MHIELSDISIQYIPIYTKDSSELIKGLDHLDIVYKNLISEGYRILGTEEVLNFLKGIKEPSRDTTKEIALLTLIKAKKYKGPIPFYLAGSILLYNKIKDYSELEIEETGLWTSFIFHKDDSYLEEIIG